MPVLSTIFMVYGCALVVAGISDVALEHKIQRGVCSEHELEAFRLRNDVNKSENKKD